MMTSSNGYIFRVTGPMCGEFAGHRWIPLTKASDAELWSFLWSAPEQTIEQITEMPLSWFWRHCNAFSRQFLWRVDQTCWRPGARLTKAYDVTIQRCRKSHAKIEDSKMHILRCMSTKFCVKFQRCPLKFHTKFWTHTPQNMYFMRCWKFDDLWYLKSYDILSLSETGPW